MAHHLGVLCAVGEYVLEKLQDSERKRAVVLAAFQGLLQGLLGRTDLHAFAVATCALRRFFSCFVSPFGGHFGDPHFFRGTGLTFGP
jgi:hypothetical protein